MGFGLRDSDWVDPYDRPDGPMACDVCKHGRECPSGDWFYCTENDEFYTPDEDEPCVDFEEG